MLCITGISAILFFATSCSTTEQVRGVETSGFLGDYSQLHPGKSDHAMLVYLDPTADFSKYQKVMIEPVQLWAADDKTTKLGKLSKEDQQLLVDYFYTALHDALAQDYIIVTAPGPDVLVVHCAITEANASHPVRQVASTVTPIGLGLSLTKRVVFGTRTGVGAASVEGELLDGGTGKRIAAAVDRRAGTKGNLLRGNFGQWADVDDAFDFWAHRLQGRLAQMRANEI